MEKGGKGLSIIFEKKEKDWGRVNYWKRLKEGRGGSKETKPFIQLGEQTFGGANRFEGGGRKMVAVKFWRERKEKGMHGEGTIPGERGENRTDSGFPYTNGQEKKKRRPELWTV